MASAPAPSFYSTKETTNYARLCRLLVDVGSQVLRETFDKKRPPGNLNTILLRPSIHSALKSLRQKKVINPSQWGKLYPAIKSSVSSRDFDITLLTVLLRNICGLAPPASGWDTLPPAADTTLEAHIVRIKCYRNTVYSHASEASVDDATFSQYWQDIRDALVPLGGAGYQSAIDDLKKECMDPDFVEHYKELLKEWVMDEKSIKERLDEIEEKISKMDDRSIKKIRPEAVKSYTNSLKASIKSQTEYHSLTSTNKSRVKTDDIFTRFLIQHGRKPVVDLGIRRKDHLRGYGSVSGKPVKHHQEIFLSNTKEANPKSVLVSGKAGIGKTLFCQKLIRDWAENKLFQLQSSPRFPDFKFAYLLTFRQLNLLGEDPVSLREILNRSSMLDVHSSIDETLFEYMVDHPEEVLIIIDGYDESSHQDFISSDLDDQYPNNPHEEMSVAALCAKLIKGKLLRGSCVTITSRPDESDKMEGGQINFDRYVEITGFSAQQVKEYVGKYFRENEEMKNTVMDHISKNDNLLSFAHIPVLCFLMCSYFEFILKESENTDALPINSSDIYFEVINMFLRKHHKKTVASPDDTLEKLSEVAAQFLLEKKFLFIVEDLRRFTSEEIKNLTTSGLLHCGPPFRKSFSETTKHFCFTHLTLQEYLAARWFVKRKEIPSSRENVSEMVFQFMSGILSKEKDNAFMEELLDEQIFLNNHTARLLTTKCLKEYKDQEFAQHIIKKRYNQFCDRDGEILYENLTDADCIAISFLLDVIRALNEVETNVENHTSTRPSGVPLARRLSMYRCFHTQSGLRRILKMLEKEHCPIAELRILRGSGLSDECAGTVQELLPRTKLTHLTLYGIKLVTDAGVVSLCQALQTATCTVTTLDLSGNQITHAGYVSLCQTLPTAACKITTLDLSENQISDASLLSLCQALQSATCKVTTLNLSSAMISGVGIVSLCQALQTAESKITTLNLSGVKITDAIVTLCQALQTETCVLTTLNLSSNEILDFGVVSLCQALTTATCKVNTLDLSENKISDVGITVLCQALLTATSQITTLNLSSNEITDAGIVSLCEALQTATCKLTTLDLSSNQIANAGVDSLCQALQSEACKVTTIVLSGNRIFGANIVSLSQALRAASCKVTTLDLTFNKITDADVAILCQALQKPTCQMTKLHLSHNHITDLGLASLCQTLQTATCKLTSLRLNYNDITDAGVVSLCEALQNTTCSLTGLFLQYNLTTDAGGQRLRNLMDKRPNLVVKY